MRRRVVGILLPLFVGAALAGCIAPRGAPPETPGTRAGAGPRGGTGGGPGGGEDSGIRAYDRVVTDEAVTDSGMFHVHRIDEQLLFEVPFALMDNDMLLVTRTARTTEGLGFGGSKLNTQTLRWERRDDRVDVRVRSFNNVADPSQPVSLAVESANFAPILASFEIEAFNEDSTAAVIDVSEMFTRDVPMLGISNGAREAFRVRSIDNDRTYIRYARAFPQNVEVRHVLTYSAQTPPSNSSTNTISVEMNQSMVLLPETPMMPRLWDERVGYFSITQVDYGRSDQAVQRRRYITRWRLEPSDTAAFRRGELVTPVKPIVYYIDPATPEKWRPYLKAGVEDWNVAFEEAGFRNAIEARDPPSMEEDPEFSPEDVRYSVIRWFPSEIQNAFGPHVHDPRSGEILESDIGWFHNVARLLRNWYFIQTAAANPAARNVMFEDEVMGKLIRFVSAHEVGHTLGLPHNMKSSSAFPVDSLRSPGFVCREGVAPSIMDYARFNYVAQPDDEGVCFDPKVGAYDRYAIEWGYRPILDADSPDEEEPTLDRWIREHDGDPVYLFGDPSAIDPTSLTEAIGSDAMEAGELGIENLKRIVPNLLEWSRQQDGEDYAELQDLYNNVVNQWRRYMGHVVVNIGGVTRTRKAQGQEGVTYEFVPEDTQRRALDFLAAQAFDPPTWLVDEAILARIENPSTLERIRGLQVGVLNSVLDPGRMQRLIESEARSDETYTLDELLSDLRGAVWSELRSGAPIDVFRRNLQRGYLERLDFLMNTDLGTPNFAFGNAGDFFTRVDVSQSDIRAFVRGELMALQSEIQRALARGPARVNRLHLLDAQARIEDILDPDA